MKKRLRKRKKIRGGRAVFRCIADPTYDVTYWQGPDGVFRPLMRTQNVYLEVEKKVKRTLLDAHELDAVRVCVIQARDARFVPEDIYEALPEWAKMKEEPTP